MAQTVNGLLAPGNIDTSTIAPVRNPDGSVSTVRSISINQDGKEVLIPTVVNGRVVSNDEAVAQYRKTGKHLGIFDTPQNASSYAQSLHEREAMRVMPKPAVQYSDVPEGATVVHDPAQYSAQYSDIPEGATVVQHGTPPDASSSLDVGRRRIGDVLAGLGFPSMATISHAVHHPLDTAIDAAKYAGTGQLAKNAVMGLLQAPYTLGKAFTEAAPVVYDEAGALFSTSPNYKGPPIQMPSEEEQARGAKAAGTFAATVPVVAGEVNAAKGIAKEFAGPLNKATGGAARELYQKGLQPSPRAHSVAQIDAMVKTGLDNGLPITRGGLNKLDSLVNDLNDSIESDIASRPNAPISPTEVVKRLRSASAEASGQVNPEGDIAAIQASKEQFLRQHQVPLQPALPGQNPLTGMTTWRTGSPAAPYGADIPIPAIEAQRLKTGTYKRLNANAYGEVSTAATEAQKALARGLKEELEGYFPEIQGKNAAEGSLLDLRPELEAAVNRLGNRRISLANIVNVMADPAVTSRLAIILHKAGVSPATIASRVGALQKLAIGAGLQAGKSPDDQ